MLLYTCQKAILIFAETMNPYTVDFGFDNKSWHVRNCYTINILKVVHFNKFRNLDLECPTFQMQSVFCHVVLALIV